MNATEIALCVAWRYVGTPYRWGGDDPSGVDCSGLIVECYQAAGFLPRSVDLTAEGLRRRYEETTGPVPGGLVFWLRGGAAFHVGLVIGEDHYIGAEGGGSSTKTLADAWEQNAYVKVRPIASRPGDLVFAVP